MLLRAGDLRSLVFGLPIDQARFAVRGFNCASPARARLEQVGMNVVSHYNVAVAEGCGENLTEHLGFVSKELCGFAHEGAAMGLFAIDSLAPFSRGNFERFIEGDGGTTFTWRSSARASRSAPPPPIRTGDGVRALLHPHHGWLRVLPRVLPDRAHGQASAHSREGGRERDLSRALRRGRWSCAVVRRRRGSQAHRLHDCDISAAAAASALAGAGLAATYAGGVSREWIGRLLELAAGHEVPVALGSLLACHARHRAGTRHPTTIGRADANGLDLLAAAPDRRRQARGNRRIRRYDSRGGYRDSGPRRIRSSLSNSIAHGPATLRRSGQTLEHSGTTAHSVARPSQGAGRDEAAQDCPLAAGTH